MRILAIQVVIVAIALIALGGAIRRFSRRDISLRRLLAWAVLWIAAAVVVLVPQTSERLAAALGVGRGVDVVIYLSIALLFYLQYRLFARLDRIERDITKIVRESALCATRHSERSEESPDVGDPSLRSG